MSSHTDADDAESPGASSLGALDRLPPDLLASHVWTQLPRRDRRALRLASRGLARLTAEAVMSRLTVAVCRASLLTLTSHNHKLHQRFPRPTRLALRLLPPAGANRRLGEPSEAADSVAGGAGGSAADAAGGAEFAGFAGGGGGPEWVGSQAVMSYFLSELGASTTLTALSLQGWQELQSRDLHHVAASYPRLQRLHLAGLPGNNYLHGHVLGALGKAGAAALRELVIDTQVVMDAAAALAALSAAALPSLAALQLSGLPLLGSWQPLPLAGLGAGLTRLELTFEHRHSGAEAALSELGRLGGLRHLALDFMQLGSGSSLWSAGWLLCHVLSRLPALTCLRLPRAFLYDQSHPAYLATLAARLPALTELGLGSAILSEETVAALGGGARRRAAAAAAAAGPGQQQALVGGESGGGGGAAAGLEPATPAAVGTAGAGRDVGAGAFGSGAAQAAAGQATTSTTGAAAAAASPMSTSPGSAGGAGDSGGDGEDGGGSGGSSGSTRGEQRERDAGSGSTPAAASTSTAERNDLAPATPAAAGAAGAADAGGSSSGDASGGAPALGAVPPPGATLVRHWRRLALGAAMPCYLELLLRALGIEPVGADKEEEEEQTQQQQQQRTERDGSEGRGGGGVGREGGPATPAPGRRRPDVPDSAGRGGGGYGAAAASAGGGGGGGGGTARTGSLDLLELCTPATLPMVQLLPRYVRSGSSGSSSAGSSSAGAGGGGGGVKEVRLLLRLGGNWAEVVAALRRLGRALTGLALMPTFLYGSGTMITEPVVEALAAGLPHLTHLELYRLNIAPEALAAALARLPALRYLLLGVADEARERRGRGHPAALVAAALEALHQQRRRQQRWRVAHSGLLAAGAADAAAETGTGTETGTETRTGTDTETGAAPCDPHSADREHDKHHQHHHQQQHQQQHQHHQHHQNQNQNQNQQPADDSVVCCPELSEAEAAAFNEAAELQYGVYDSGGARLRVARAAGDRSLPARLAVGCSMAQTGWQA
ncbi:hypothetical protein HXX76_004840 [Chlamydomonas incerta]|uniref:Uncharacterized protein n=1 Tax=Chlamydomonas incerta TaxID=51695 RepID=A0A835T8N4_CHLIN|nr:hypothetical protein HXX76_004840 [Chlamydomonas incerta]|eukprot:KAG2439486.1 hypothetical protein HXX76_004840 [Chlamydomonas incerta]